MTVKELKEYLSRQDESFDVQIIDEDGIAHDLWAMFCDRKRGVVSFEWCNE